VLDDLSANPPTEPPFDERPVFIRHPARWHDTAKD
jgi:hypothetical protein